MEAGTSAVCSFEHLAKALHQQKNAGPASAGKILKALPKPIRPPLATLIGMLNEGVRRGELWEYFPNEDEVRYWTQPPHALAWAIIESALTLKGQTDVDLRKKLSAIVFRGQVDPQKFLNELISEGRIYPCKKGKTIRYRLEPIDIPAVIDEAWKLVQSKLAAGPETEAVIKRAVKSTLESVLEPDEFLRGLVADQRIHRIPGPGKGVRYSLQPMDYRFHATQFQKLVADFAAKVRTTASKLGIAEENATELIQDALRREFSMQFLVGASRPAAGSSQKDSRASTGRFVATEWQEQILQAMREMNPRTVDGDLVVIPELRKRIAGFGISKEQFDQVLLGLFRQRRVILSRISAALISDADRSQYVIDEDGNYYNTIAFWRHA